MSLAITDLTNAAEGFIGPSQIQVLTLEELAQAEADAATAAEASQKAYDDTKASMEKLADAYEAGDISASEYVKALKELKAEAAANAKQNPELRSTYEDVADILENELTDNTLTYRAVLVDEKLKLIAATQAEIDKNTNVIAVYKQLANDLNSVGTAYKTGGSGSGGSSAASKAKEETEKVSEAIQEELDYLDLLQSRSQITYKEIAGYLQNMLDTYELNAAEREKIEQKLQDTITKIINDTAKERADTEEKLNTALQKKVTEAYANNYDEAVKWIDKRVAAGEMGVDEEIAAYERLIDVYAEGTDEYTAALEGLSAAQDKLISRQLEIADEIDDIDQAYQDVFESRKDALYATWGLFDEVAELEEVSKETLIKNLQDQGKALLEWRNNLAKIASQEILSDALLSELQELGPSAAAEIKALASMTKGELQLYQNTWDDNNTLIIDIATNEVAIQDAYKEAEEKKAELEAELANLDDSTSFELTIDNENALNSILEVSLALNRLAGVKDGETDSLAGKLEEAARLEAEYDALRDRISEANTELAAINDKIAKLEGLIVDMQTLATETQALAKSGGSTQAAIAEALGLDASLLSDPEAFVNSILADSNFYSEVVSLFADGLGISDMLDTIYVDLTETDYDFVAAANLDYATISQQLDDTNGVIAGYIEPMTDTFEDTYTSVYDAVGKLNEKMHDQTMDNLLTFMNDLIATMQAKVDELRALANEAASLGGYVSSGGTSGGSTASGESVVLNMPITYNASEQSTEMDAQVLGETIAGYVKSALAGKGVR